METVDLNLFKGQYRGRRVAVTGHTGFKGSWLTLWLHTLGAHVTGYALAPHTSPNHWDLLNLPATQRLSDVRDAAAVREWLTSEAPEIVFHFAAQPLVRLSYATPLETWSTNVMGTANVLEACRSVSSVQAIVVITTDKCYENHEWHWGYRENDRLGGHDPYSASKAGTELVASSYRSSFFNQNGAPLLATARAGNVIGGGDWSQDRLIPDLVRAVTSGKPLFVRSPNATRPWQHVLESLSGYLLLGQHLLEGNRDCAQAWNIGPDSQDNCTVKNVLTRLRDYWPELQWEAHDANHQHEANLLYLDSSKAKAQLGWRPVWSLDQTLEMTAEWYRTQHEKRIVLSYEQLHHYIDQARNHRLSWSGEWN